MDLIQEEDNGKKLKDKIDSRCWIVFVKQRSLELLEHQSRCYV